MNVETFLHHHGLHRHPFVAEEARLDPVFLELSSHQTAHPELVKVLGDLRHPSSAVVFGEKGSGKTAMRLQLSRHVETHNQSHPDQRLLVVAYDDLNGFFDRLMQRRRQDPEAMLQNLRLSDHQDAMLGQAVTTVVDELLTSENWHRKSLRGLTGDQRIRLLTLAMLYDQPTHGERGARFARLRRKLGVCQALPLRLFRETGLLLMVLGIIFALAHRFGGEDLNPWWVLPAAVLTLAGGLLSLGFFALRSFFFWNQSRRIARAMPAVEQDRRQLRQMMAQMGRARLAGQPLAGQPSTEQAGADSRYQLTRQLIDALACLRYSGLMVLVDRVDEPTVISGDVQRMQACIWPMLDNKFLQQKQVGIKLLLPMELRHLLYRESPRFFQEARLDKQNLVEQLNWSGAMLYDLCNDRMRACSDGSKQENVLATLGDLFAEDVSREMIGDALDQMHQPRDAFKLLHAVIQEHCSLVCEDEQAFRIPRLTLETVRREQTRRAQSFDRGMSPA